MKTLVFCTTYADRRATWDARHSWWLKALRQSQLKFDQVLMVDDASPELPLWNEVAVVRERTSPTPASLHSDAPVVLYTHEERLGRHSVFDFPGWHRSFAFGAKYASAHGFEKVIHLESDAFLISERVQKRFNVFREGWAALWSDRYTFPELALQVAAGREVAAMAAFASRPYADLVGRLHETAVPYTHVDTSFSGDRFGEIGDPVPRYTDFAAQALAGQPASYYWWISDQPELSRETFLAPLPLLAAAEAPAERTQYFPPYESLAFEGGWSHVEPGIRWMMESDSRVFIPAVREGADHHLELDLRPSEESQEGQRLYVCLNERMVASIRLLRSTTITCHVSAADLRTDGENCLRFIHPDAASPAAVAGSNDLRLLSVGLTRIGLEKVSSVAAALAPRRKRFWR